MDIVVFLDRLVLPVDGVNGQAGRDKLEGVVGPERENYNLCSEYFNAECFSTLVLDY